MSELDAFAVVELMGHRRTVGRVTEATIAGGEFIRVDATPLGVEGRVMTIEERAARLREGRAHYDVCCGMQVPVIPNITYVDNLVAWHSFNGPPGHPVSIANLAVCTDDHNPTETALDAAALLFDVSPDRDVRAAARVAYDLIMHPGSGTTGPFVYKGGD